MITLTVTTQLVFKNRKMVDEFINSQDVKKLVGFDKEIIAARDLGIPVAVSVPRPKFGAVSVSTICYSEIGEVAP